MSPVFSVAQDSQVAVAAAVELAATVLKLVRSSLLGGCPTALTPAAWRRWSDASCKKGGARRIVEVEGAPQKRSHR
jgi:hypothetical protein